MKPLLDTRTFLGAISDDGRLSRRVQQTFTGPHDLWLSVASIGEILIKAKAGELSLPEPSGPYLVRKLGENRIEVQPIKSMRVLRMENLAVHHHDPFDRILTAQSIEEKLPLTTADPIFERYPVSLMRASVELEAKSREAKNQEPEADYASSQTTRTDHSRRLGLSS